MSRTGPGAALTEGLTCTSCRHSLSAAGEQLACAGCGSRYLVDDGVVLLLPSSLDKDREPEEAYWRELAPKVERPWREIKGHLAAGLDKLFIPDLPREGRVLEIGAGSCWASCLVKAARPQLTLTASDLSPSALRRARPIEDETGGRIDRFVACDMESLPFADAYFDIVFGVAVLHHAADLSGALREVCRVLKPGGRFFGLDELATNALFARWWRTSPSSPFANRHAQLGVREEVHTLSTWRKALDSAGFRTIDVRFNRDWRLKRSEGLRRLYFRVTAPLPDPVFAMLAGGSLVLKATR